MPQQKASSFADDLRALEAGSFAADLAALSDAQTAAPAVAPAKRQGLLDRLLADNVALPPLMRAGQTAMRAIREHPVQTGAIAGGLVAAPLTGGGSIPASMAAAGLGAAGGAGLGIAARQLDTGVPESAGHTVRTMAAEGLAGAAGEGAGRVASKGLELAGRGLYRAALLPINQVLGKHGDVVKTGLKHAVPVSAKAGVPKAAAIRGARTAAKKEALNAADERVLFRAKGITDDALSQLDDRAISLDLAGEGDPSAVFQKRMDVFAAKNPDGTLTPSRLERIKSTLDDRNGLAYQKLRKREPLTPKEDARMALTHAASRAQESAVPRYREMNKDIMDAVGLEKAIQRRTTGSGGNQGLENAMAMLGGASALPARIAMLPPVLSRIGIGTYKASGVPFNDALKTALIAALGQQQE